MDVFDEIGKVDIVITDPPYGINVASTGTTGKAKMVSALMLKKRLNVPYITDYGPQKWDKKLNKKYIDAILSISENQIIFGGNYYADWLLASSCWLVWDKKNGKTDYSDCELIYTSFNTAVRKIEFQWNGFWQGDMKNKEKRYHPTQKPVYVMRWIIDKYTKETDTILDPFMGSGSTGIACVIGGRKFIGIEKEKQYFDIACKRIRWVCKQNALF